MGNETSNAPETVAVTCATWVYVLHAAGVVASDTDVATACSAITEASDAATGEHAGNALVAAISSLLTDDGPDSVASLARRLFGVRVGTDLGHGSRDARLARIRQYQFNASLPWLARIWERTEGHASPAPCWLIVERVTDQVEAMDPNPWNDVDEERRIPVADFQVLWELDGCTSIRVG